MTSRPKQFREKAGCPVEIGGYVGPVDLQTSVALLIVAIAAAGLLWSLVRRRKFSFERDTPCGCSTPSRSANGGSIVFHARKGERPSIIVKGK